MLQEMTSSRKIHCELAETQVSDRWHQEMRPEGNTFLTPYIGLSEIITTNEDYSKRRSLYCN